MIIVPLVLGPIQTNCYIVASAEGRQGAVIDPCDDAPSILAAAKEAKIEIGKILLTHGHFDHILGLADLKKATGVTVGIHEADAKMLEDPLHSGAATFGFSYEPCPADYFIGQGEVIEIDGLAFESLHTPGHTPGGISFFQPAQGEDKPVVFSGDALFCGSIGRTDFPGGNHGLLLSSIREKLFTLPDETIVYSGHGPETTVGFEKQNNPFLQ